MFMFNRKRINIIITVSKNSEATGCRVLNMYIINGAIFNIGSKLLLTVASISVNALF